MSTVFTFHLIAFDPVKVFVPGFLIFLAGAVGFTAMGIYARNQRCKEFDIENPVETTCSLFVGVIYEKVSLFCFGGGDLHVVLSNVVDFHFPDFQVCDVRTKILGSRDRQFDDRVLVCG